MIIDRLATESEWVRKFIDRARVIEAPFALLPPWESRLIGKAALVPRDGDRISGQFAKPPFPNVVIFGNGDEGREQGALLVQSTEVAHVDKRFLELVPADATHVLLVTVTGMTPRFDCLVAYRFLSFCGEHFSSTPHMDLVHEMSKQAFVQINGFSPERVGAELAIDENDWRSFIQHQVGAIAALFALLNCRNVVSSRVVPDAKLQRARQKAGKHPLYAYATLKMRSATSSNGSDKLRPIHWVRGHFKEYTPERPLFGKISGLFWWEPHLVGADLLDYRGQSQPNVPAVTSA